MLSLQLRPFTPTDADYEAVVAVRNAALPDYRDTPDDWRHWDEFRPDFCKWERWIAEIDGVVVASGGFYHISGMFHPQKFWIDGFVHPDYQGRGVGQALYARLIERLAPFNPIALRTEAREDHAAANHILRKQGYEEEMKFWESRLDVAAFDPAPFGDAEMRVRDRAIEIVTLRDLMERGESYQRPLYEALVEMQRDVPRPDEYTPTPFEAWLKAVLGDHNLLPEGYFIAMHQGQIAGVSQLWNGAEAGVLYTGLTATRRDYRRMGIALALKVRAIAFAKQRGAREIRTGNETRNRAMLSINEALGFVKQPVWISFVKQL
jgi:GNAT superfamily N-acetyltransferase